jgi:hypothetical protein
MRPGAEKLGAVAQAQLTGGRQRTYVAPRACAIWRNGASAVGGMGEAAPDARVVGGLADMLAWTAAGSDGGHPALIGNPPTLADWATCPRVPARIL